MKRKGTNETVSSIIAEMRKVAHNVAIANKETLSQWRPAAFLSRVADRLLAAYKHERSDFIATRRVDDAMKKYLQESNWEKEGEIVDLLTKNEELQKKLDARAKDRRKRNCDAFTDISDARKAWEKECLIRYETDHGAWYKLRSRKPSFEKWLFKHAKGKKGETK